MRPSKTVLWIGTIAIMVIMSLYSRPFRKAEVKGIVAFEFADATEGQTIIDSWKQHDLIDDARRLIRIDFIFLVFYVLLMLRCSADQMSLEPSVFLNDLLRFNIVLAILTGLLDIAENFIMFHNLKEKGSYIRSYWLTLPKFIFAGWVIVVFLISVAKRLLTK